MIDGLTLTIVGMLTVFAFLVVLVAAMSLLRQVARRLPTGESPGGRNGAVIAAAVAAAHHAVRSRQGREPNGRT